MVSLLDDLHQLWASFKDEKQQSKTNAAKKKEDKKKDLEGAEIIRTAALEGIKKKLPSSSAEESVSSESRKKSSMKYFNSRIADTIELFNDSKTDHLEKKKLKYEHKERLKDKERAHELEKMRLAHEFQCQLMKSFMFGQAPAFTSPSPPSLNSTFTDDLTEEL